jgi:cell division protein FtsW (lipid II flippase)
VQVLQQSDKISGYLKIVCEQIRWKKAHDVISKEIENHIIDQKNALIAKGFDEETATDKAIKEMGDPIVIGSELDRTHRPKIEWSLIVLTGITLLIGLAIRVFITYDSDMPGILTNSIISIVLGIACMTITYFIDFTTIGKYPRTIYFGLIAVTIGIMIVSPVINGRYFYVQFILLLFPTAFTGIIYCMRTRGYLGIILSSTFLAVPVFIGLIIPSFSSAILCSLTCLILVTFAIARGWFNVNKLNAMLLVYIPIVSAGTAIFFINILNVPYRLARLQSSINPSHDPMGAGYVGSVTRDMIANSKFFVKVEMGINSGIRLPNIATDHLLTYSINRFGWISFISIMAVMVAFIIRSYMLCSRQKSVLGRLVSTSVLITFTMQVALYVVNNLGFQLFSPLTLPLISYSGTATIINMILIGIMLSVFKSGYLVRENITTST